jgi:hypothetical protein
MMNRFIVLIFALAAICLQHPIHEYAHAVTAKLLGEKVVQIQWLTYFGGTRVFYENEPNYESAVAKKWAVIAGAGYITTNSLAYIFVCIYYCLSSGWIKAFVCILSIIFLLCDSLYFALGSVFNFGDVVGVRNALKLSHKRSVFLCFTILVINIAIAKMVFY